MFVTNIEHYFIYKIYILLVCVKIIPKKTPQHLHLVLKVINFPSFNLLIILKFKFIVTKFL